MAGRVEGDLDRLDNEPGRIDHHTSTIEKRSIARQLPEETDVAVPLDLLAPETLVTLVSVVRRPPELQLSMGSTDRIGSAPDPDLVELQSLGQMTTPDLGYNLASFLVRREGQVAESNDPYVKAGFAELELSSRMLEHLMIKRTSGIA